uniref:PA domain-containing protein n=1 Tax=Rhodosorus marinus TaxID=101924 RepID=A0A7S3EA50_9RHOD
MGRVEYRVICMTIWMSMIVIGGAEPVVVVLKGGEEVCGLYNPMFAALPASSGKGRASQYVKMTISEPLNACEKLVGDGFSGSAVLVERGSCSFAEKAQHVERAGGSLVVVENTEDSFITPVANASLGEYDEVNIPVIVVNHSGGLVLRTGDDVRLNAYEIVEPAWLAVGEEFASVVAGLIGVLVVVCGSILATKPKDRVSLSQPPLFFHVPSCSGPLVYSTSSGCRLLHRPPPGLPQASRKEQILRREMLRRLLFLTDQSQFSWS